MTVEIYLWNPQTQTWTLVQTVNNVTSQQTISAACGSVVCTPTPYTDSQREDYGGGMYAQRSANFTLWTLAATAAQGYQFSRFDATWTGENIYKPFGSDPEVTSPWAPTDSSSFSTPWAAVVTSQPSDVIADGYRVDGAYEGTDRWDAFVISASYDIHQTTSLTCRAYFSPQHVSTGLLIRNGSGTGLLRGDTTPLPLVDA